VRALLCPASLKGVLSAAEAAVALGEGFRSAGGDATELPVADGGEGTADVLQRKLGGEWLVARASDPLGRPIEARWLLLPDGRAVLEAASAIGLPLVRPEERDPLRASSRGFGELLRAALAERPRAVLVGLGGVATVDGGAGLRDVVDSLPIPTTVLCDVRTTLHDAARVYGPQKGAGPEDVRELEQRIAAMHDLEPYASLPGSGAAGGIGAALAALGAALAPGAPQVLDLLGFDDAVRGCDLVVTGEGEVDDTTSEGKAPGEVASRATAAGVRCVLFGGRVLSDVAGAETLALSGVPERAQEDLVALGSRLAAETR
jgi:glycerate 2-kinase